MFVIDILYTSRLRRLHHASFCFCAVCKNYSLRPWSNI